jgi:hypothetical protein
MGIFDPPNDKRLSDDYPYGTVLKLYAGNYEGMRDTQFGPQASASVDVGPANNVGELLTYKVWGTLAEQVAQLEQGELPQLVKVAKQGNRNVWVPCTEDGENIPF